MSNQMKVYLVDKVSGDKKITNCELIRWKQTTAVVRLPDGNIISRSKKRIPKEYQK